MEAAGLLAAGSKSPGSMGGHARRHECGDEVGQKREIKMAKQSRREQISD